MPKIKDTGFITYKRKRIYVAEDLIPEIEKLESDFKKKLFSKVRYDVIIAKSLGIKQKPRAEIRTIFGNDVKEKISVDGTFIIYEVKRIIEALPAYIKHI